MTTMEEYYEMYRSTCYGDKPLHPVQAKEVKQAFYGGALIMFELLGKATEKSEAEAFKILDGLHEECRAYGKELASKSWRQN